MVNIVNIDIGELIKDLDGSLEVGVRLANGRTKVFNLLDELAVSEETLNEDFSDQASKYAWWSVVAESAKGLRDELEVEVDVAESRADRKVREDLEMEGTKITESLVKSRIKLDEDYLSALRAYNASKRNAAVLERLLRSFEHRKEMLISFGAHLRNEQNNNNTLRSLESKVKDVMVKKNN